MRQPKQEKGRGEQLGACGSTLEHYRRSLDHGSRLEIHEQEVRVVQEPCFHRYSQEQSHGQEEGCAISMIPDGDIHHAHILNWS